MIDLGTFGRSTFSFIIKAWFLKRSQKLKRWSRHEKHVILRLPRPFEVQFIEVSSSSITHFFGFIYQCSNRLISYWTKTILYAQVKLVQRAGDSLTWYIQTWRYSSALTLAPRADFFLYKASFVCLFEIFRLNLLFRSCFVFNFTRYY